MNAIEWARAQGACPLAIEWLATLSQGTTMAEAWDRCERPDWVIWALTRSPLSPEAWLGPVVGWADWCAQRAEWYAYAAKAYAAAEAAKAAKAYAAAAAAEAAKAYAAAKAAWAYADAWAYAAKAAWADAADADEHRNACGRLRQVLPNPWRTQ